MTLSAGAQFGPYQILSALGAGGMGEVYKARDTRLERIVAIKVLRASLAADPEFRERFDREARTVSQLDHPDICALYDVGEQDGTAFLVMQYLEGETLADRLLKGALPLDQALQYAIQISGALEQAHRAGVVHRDLKPGNVMLTRSGAKLLDFGLAKVTVPQATAGLSMLPTTPPNITVQGTILGTFQYMAPEQLDGKDADTRSDVFAFGAVLYEMVTGIKAFSGASHASLISAIMLSDPPPMAAAQPRTPPALGDVVAACLIKDPDSRWQSATDLRRELKWIVRDDLHVSMPPALASRRLRLERVAWAVATLVLVIVAISVLFARSLEPASTAGLSRVQIALPAGSLSFTLSPDGRTLAFIAPGPTGRNQFVWIRPMDSLEPRALPGTEGALTPPFWSPDSQFIAFYAGGKLKKIDRAGGLPTTICDAPMPVVGGAWNADDVIIFGGGRIMQVPASGGAAAPVTLGSQEQFHAFPSFLPDGHHFVYLRFGAPPDQGIYLGSLLDAPAEQSRQMLVASPLMPTYVPAPDSVVGHLLFMRDGTLLARPFDENRLAFAGEAVPVAERVGIFRLSANFSTSENGVLAYRTAGAALSRLMWYDRTGTALGPAGDPGAYWDLTLSRDGARAAITLDEGRAAGQGISVMDVARGVLDRFTFEDEAWHAAPVWSPDGRSMAFVAQHGDGNGVYHKSFSTGGKERVLLAPTVGLKWTNDWSRNGRVLLFSSQDPRTRWDLWVLPLTPNGAPAGPAAPFARTEFNERQGQFSPDTRWIAYVSDESGTPDIWVAPFPASTERSKLRISSGGGSQPRWRHNGRELFYISPDGSVMAVDFAPNAEFKPTPKALFAAPMLIGDESANEAFRWDVAAGGDRFLVDIAATASEPLTIVLNWTKLLEK